MGKLTGIIQYSGKLSNSVGMRGQNGRNYIRLRRTEIKNPKSDAQCIQRMILATVAISIAFLKEICDNSVEGKRNGSETLAYLRGQWMRMLRVENIFESPYNYAKKGSNFFAVNPYMLSRGSLAAPAVSVDISTNSITCSELNITAGNASEVFPSIAIGNQITIVAVGIDGSGEENRPFVKYCRFAFKTLQQPPFYLSDDNVSYVLNEAAIDETKASGDWDKLRFTMGKIGMDDFLDGQNLAAVALIVSNITDKKRSTSYLVLADGLAKQWSAADAYLTYGDQVVSYDMVNSEYLNNSAVVGGDIEGVVSLQNAPVAFVRDGRTDFNVMGCPSEPTDVRLTFHLNDGTDIESGNLVGLTTADNIITGVSIYNAPTFSDGTWTIAGENNTQNNYTITGGYAICDGVKFTF